MTNRIEDLELRLTRENIDNYKLETLEKMNPEDIEKYQIILEKHADITGLEKLLDITTEKATFYCFGVTPQAPQTLNGSINKIDTDFYDPTRQETTRSLQNIYEKIGFKIALSIRDLLNKKEKSV